MTFDNINNNNNIYINLYILHPSINNAFNDNNKYTAHRANVNLD